MTCKPCLVSSLYISGYNLAEERGSLLNDHGGASGGEVFYLLMEISYLESFSVFYQYLSPFLQENGMKTEQHVTSREHRSAERSL